MPLSEGDCEDIRAVLQSKATGYRYRDVGHWLDQAGFVPPRKPGGSHRVWTHPTGGQRAQLVDKGHGEILPVYVKRAIRKILESGACPD